MSEMKPVAWSYYKRYGFEWTLEFTETPLEKGLLRVAQITPLYTADQLAEAVAAERERILRTHNISAEDDLFWYFDDREYGHNNASELLQANEFEIVHIATGRNTGELFGFSAKDEDYFFKTEAEAVAAIEAIRSAAK